MRRCEAAYVVVHIVTVFEVHFLHEVSKHSLEGLVTRTWYVRRFLVNRALFLIETSYGILVIIVIVRRVLVIGRRPTMCTITRFEEDGKHHITVPSILFVDVIELPFAALTQK
eukprot:GHVU01224899.1.p2 GENE.GHVU01224899.1~~GHVU01224899.1.p2  ORF type:complete len:113 (+),score=13.85 GHVU01224899.1:312-650(+)